MALQYRGILNREAGIERKKQDFLVFTNGANPSVYYYKRLEIPPHLVYNLLEDKKPSFFTFDMQLTEQELDFLSVYDPAMDRGQKLDQLLKSKEFQERKNTRDAFNNPVKTETIWGFAIGEILFRRACFSSLDHDRPAIAELEKGWNDWLLKNPQPSSVPVLKPA